MFFKSFIVSVMTSIIFFCGTAQAYDLPKIKIDKKADRDQKNSGTLKSDWESTKKFHERLEHLLHENKSLKASDPERLSADRNLIFVAFYEGYAYFLDRYSVEVKKDSNQKRSWTQRIYPIGEGISARNAKSTTQKFSLIDDKKYNSSGRKDAISDLKNESDKNFLEECFKVGYFYSFGEE